MGHWADSLVNEAVARLPAGIDQDRVLAALRAAGTQIETLAGHSFGPPKRHPITFGTFGLPFVEVPGLWIGSEEGPDNFWPVPNPVDRTRATVAQVAEFAEPTERAMPVAHALRAAGNLVHMAAHSGLLSREYVLMWLGRTFPPDDRTAFFREIMDDSYHAHVPIAAGQSGGWWFQITRRILWVTQATEEPRLLEPLIPDGDVGMQALAAVEPLLIVSDVTSHPADWAMGVRIWPSIERSVGMTTRWRVAAAAIHEHGIPILSLDPESTPEELQCQLLLLAYWHKYAGVDELEMADALASAYPKAVERIARATRTPDRRAAAAILFEGLMRPGFDPDMGAAAARRYVSRKATVAILNQRKAADGRVRPWEALGVSERRYYKLLKQFAPKIGARYEVDAGVLERIRNHLIGRDQETEKHAAAMAVLQERGFGYEAARKWLQRHDYSEAPAAKPRRRRTGPP